MSAATTPAEKDKAANYIAFCMCNQYIYPSAARSAKFTDCFNKTKSKLLSRTGLGEIPNDGGPLIPMIMAAGLGTAVYMMMKK